MSSAPLLSVTPDDSCEVLDRTEELPVLDVAAYEARLREDGKEAPRTIRAMAPGGCDLDADPVGPQQIPVLTRVMREPPAGSEALTANVQRILRRIAELEGNIKASHEANAALAKRIESVQLERDQQVRRLQALETENARLREERTLADEMTQRFERQLREQAQQADAELRDVQAAFSSERAHADRERAELQEQVAQLSAQHAALQDRYRAVQDQLNAAESLAGQREESGAALEKALNDEKTRTAQLARQLAAKLTESERLTALIGSRDKAIDELMEARDHALQQLQREQASRTALAAQFAAAEQSLAERHAILLERESAIAEKDLQAAELEAQLEQARASIVAVSQERDAAQAQIHSVSAERETLMTAAADISARIAEFEVAIRARDGLVESLTGELQSARDEQATLAGQMDTIRARVKYLRQQVANRDIQIAELQTDLAVHTEALAAIGRDVGRIGEGADAGSSDEVERVLEPIEHTGEPIILNGATFTVGRTLENDICIPSNLISRHHARLLVGPSGVIIEDAGSTNGCFVNGEQIRQHLMHDGDILELGDLRYRMRIRAAHDTRIRVGVPPVLSTIARTADRRMTVVPTLIEENTSEFGPALDGES